MASETILYTTEKTSATSIFRVVLRIDILRKDCQLHGQERQLLADFYEAFGRHLGADDYDRTHDGVTSLLHWLNEIAQRSDDPDHVVRLYLLAAERVPKVC